MRTVLVVILVLALVVPAPAAASQVSGPPAPERAAGPSAAAEDRLSPGARVRVNLSVRGAASVVGRIRAIDEKVLLLERLDRPGSVAFARSSIRRIEVPVGKRTRAREGAIAGGVILGVPGALWGFVAWGVSNIDCESSCNPFAPWLGAAMYGLFSAGIGALVGHGIGSRSQTDRWQAVERNGVAVSVAPTLNGGVSASVAIRF